MYDMRATRGSSAVPSKEGLLVVGRAEDEQANGKGGADCCDSRRAQVDGVHGQVPALRRVQEGHPGDVSKGEHEPQPIRGNVHHPEQARLGILSLQDIVHLHRCDEQNAVGKGSVVAVLLRDKGQVEKSPSRQAGSHFKPRL